MLFTQWLDRLLMYTGISLGPGMKPSGTLMLIVHTCEDLISLSRNRQKAAYDWEMKK